MVSRRLGYYFAFHNRVVRVVVIPQGNKPIRRLVQVAAVYNLTDKVAIMHHELSNLLSVFHTHFFPGDFHEILAVLVFLKGLCQA